ncbi:MAG: RNA pseudouridine synthase [Rhodospirillales bacterium 20-60-12]|nr:MAG: RNA pseudouridine synthase [Rhodospirillales bacterium 20-60-12]HQT68066.1 RluA family pseudouridine synthase [Acetobacteraceae bacterium]
MLSPLNETETIMAQTAHAGQRLDRFLADHLPGLSRSRLKAMVQEGDVSAQNAVLTDPNAKVRAGVAYHVALRPAVSAVPLGQDIPFTILFEDAHLIVLDKPAGLVVHPAPGNLDGTLVNALIAHCGDSLTGIGGEKRPGIVHRLDKETSGVMVAAKTQFAHAALSALFAARDLDRSYLALCWGLPSPLAGSIQGPIGRDPRDRKRMAIVSRGGKPALTHYKTLRPFGTGAALVSCQLATGRTHQIRVHLAHTGHPLIGDPVYLRRRPAAAGFLPLPARDLALDFPRQALHAASLGFVHPVTGKPVQFETKPPADFAALLAALDESAIGDR